MCRKVCSKRAFYTQVVFVQERYDGHDCKGGKVIQNLLKKVLCVSIGYTYIVYIVYYKTLFCR